MLNMILGVIAIILGVWGLFFRWMFFKDIFLILLFLGLIAFGLIALLAGIKKIRKSSNKPVEKV